MHPEVKAEYHSAFIILNEWSLCGMMELMKYKKKLTPEQKARAQAGVDNLNRNVLKGVKTE